MTAEFVRRIVDEELAAIQAEIGDQEYDSRKFDDARQLFEQVALADDFADFLTCRRTRWWTDTRSGPPLTLRAGEPRVLLVATRIPDYGIGAQVDLPYDVNLSILFTELPLLERPQAAKEAGFDAVEFWWPWPVAVPSDVEVEEFATAILGADVQLVGLNFFAGDMAGGDRGLVSWPARIGEFRDNIDVTVALGERLGCRAFNALYGNRVDGSTPEEQDDLAVQNLVLAAKAVQRIGGTVLVEPVSGAARYPLRTAAEALQVIDRASAEGVDNARLLFDIYHLAVNGDDVDAAIDASAGRIGHVQIADAPGRNEPGTGTLDIDYYLGRLAATGYDGWVGLEYQPSGKSPDSFGWLPLGRRSAAG